VVVEAKAYRRLQGRVVRLGEPVEDALVEIFDKPEYLLSPGSDSQDRPKQERLAACRTSADGKFCFRDLPSGTYELRSSFGSGWDVTHLHVMLDKKSGQNKPLEVSMHLGT
jgi:protocatechuate 3,4-dioxygenase beta subunit